MNEIIKLITFDDQNEHNSEHVLEHVRKFSTPKIYDANGDVSKRWYVYFSYRNPSTGKLERMQNIYGNANSFKNKEQRYALLSLYRDRLLKLLKAGTSPFEPPTSNARSKIKNDFHSGEPINKEINEPKLSGSSNNSESIKPSMTIDNAIDFALNLKTNMVNNRTLTDYKYRTKLFLEWLKNVHPRVCFINQINKKLVLEFLNDIQVRTSARNRNNFRTCFSSIFQVLEDNELMEKNFIKSIKPLISKPNRNRTYTEKEQKAIFSYLEKEDPILLLFIKFISYNLLRPIEICRLKIGDVDIKSKTIRFQAKNKTIKTKIIPDILLKDLPNLGNIEKDHLLFTPHEIGAKWNTKLDNRRDYFSKRFKTVVKDHFGFNENYGLYSFRHTFITQLYRSLALDSSPFMAKSALMQITGHATMEALEKYLRDIDAELPEDYSHHLKNSLK